MGMQLWNVLVFGAVQEKKHIGLWERDNKKSSLFLTSLSFCSE
jgi:hypothetical protein